MDSHRQTILAKRRATIALSSGRDSERSVGNIEALTRSTLGTIERRPLHLNDARHVTSFVVRAAHKKLLRHGPQSLIRLAGNSLAGSYGGLRTGGFGAALPSLDGGWR